MVLSERVFVTITIDLATNASGVWAGNGKPKVIRTKKMRDLVMAFEPRREEALFYPHR
jgi:hypothetical protein